jgi:hypothetical protein
MTKILDWRLRFANAEPVPINTTLRDPSVVRGRDSPFLQISLTSYIRLSFSFSPNSDPVNSKYENPAEVSKASLIP